jgi:hypothetical protein
MLLLVKKDSATWVVCAVLCLASMQSTAAPASHPQRATETLGPAPGPPIYSRGDSRALAAPAADTDVGAALSAVNTANRETSRQFFRTVYASSLGTDASLTGNLGPATREPRSRLYRERFALRINYFRAMAGVPADITFLDEYSSKSQAAALMISRNLKLDHFPTEDWACYFS